MDVIRVLPEGVIDQIAAGEVIERPASVVKELVDNAIDAGARTITVEVAKSLIRVIDDGCGMSPRDAALALERHATSKLRAVDDLWGIRTMGFRGEALPSIASVSKLTITTRQADAIAATRVGVHGGRFDGLMEVGAPVGTCVEVADLFFNVPARLKFLKADATEASHVTELVARVAMAHPELHVKLRHNGRTALDAAPDRDGFARAQALLGPRVTDRMVVATGEESGVRVTCYLGAPELAQTTARGVQLFVGRRPVRDRGLLHAIAMGYGELVARGRYPVAIVHVDGPVGSIDVNVHPQKAEVRFADPGAVHAAVRHVVQAGIARAPWRDELIGVGRGPVMMTAIASLAPPRLPFDAPATAGSQSYARELHTARAQSSLAFARDAASLRGPRAWAQTIKDRVRMSRVAERHASMATVPEAFVEDTAQLAHGSSPIAMPGFFAALRYLGQLDLTYLVCEADGELVLIDQHVAHERVELARLKGQGERSTRGTQRMLFPTMIDVRPELAQLAGELSGVLAQVGFEAEGAGPGTLAVKSVPGGIKHGDPAQLLVAFLETCAEDGAPSEAARLDRVLVEIACHSVVRAGDRLSTNEAEALLHAMDEADFSHNGVHDRPVLLRLPLTEIARRFGR
ncbi:MAG TPA: DNA mismatch repair endonuclease MutL [Kofleriaceae bacterium]|jgi:DNA mismatch repair protein MutL|nr:DNA mismatch repair endonuclease MutL [Kofleriaceae bacterium]